MAAHIRARGEPARIRAYQATILNWLVHLVVLLALWLLAGRPWSALGIRVPAAEAWLAGAGMGVLLLAVLHARARFGLLRSLDRSSLEASLGDFAELLPRSHREERWFRLVSLNAGITEELIFRGFLYWYLVELTNPGWAALGTIAVFTAAHLYQGVRQLPGIAAMSAFFIVLYLVGDAIWLPIVLHAVVDMLQGRQLRQVMARGREIDHAGRGGASS